MQWRNAAPVTRDTLLLFCCLGILVLGARGRNSACADFWTAVRPLSNSNQQPSHDSGQISAAFRCRLIQDQPPFSYPLSLELSTGVVSPDAGGSTVLNMPPLCTQCVC
jgi:hypothetical protein